MININDKLYILREELDDLYAKETTRNKERLREIYILPILEDVMSKISLDPTALLNPSVSADDHRQAYRKRLVEEIKKIEKG